MAHTHGESIRLRIESICVVVERARIRIGKSKELCSAARKHIRRFACERQSDWPEQHPVRWNAQQSAKSIRKAAIAVRNESRNIRQQSVLLRHVAESTIKRSRNQVKTICEQRRSPEFFTSRVAANENRMEGLRLGVKPNAFPCLPCNE